VWTCRHEQRDDTNRHPYESSRSLFHVFLSRRLYSRPRRVLAAALAQDKCYITRVKPAGRTYEDSLFVRVCRGPHGAATLGAMGMGVAR